MCKIMIMTARSPLQHSIQPFTSSMIVPRNGWRIVLRRVSLYLLCWGVLIAALSLQFARMASITWPQALYAVGPDWLGWMVVAPLLYLLSSRLPLEKQNWMRAIPAHLAAGTSALLLVNTTRALVGSPIPPHLGVKWKQGMPAQDSNTLQQAFALVPPERFALRSPQTDPPPFPFKPGAGWMLRFGLPFNLPMLLLIVAAAHALHFYKRAQERGVHALELEAGLARARFDVLKMQIQPHFLFNALNSIAALLHEDPEAADEMIGALSEFLRFTLANSGRREVSLQEELEFVRRYLMIEHVRFGDHLQFKVEAAPDILNAFVPVLILQPLVENAVRHALAGTGGVKIVVHACRKGVQLSLTVKDDGPGALNGVGGGGIGLANTRARLRELHGDRAGIIISPTGGFAVELTMPFRTE